MIEAVNSVLSNASATRQVVEQQSTSRSYAANPAKTQEAASKTPYVSPYISFDRNYNKAVLQIRDNDTGDVLQQYPTKTQLRAYQTAQQYEQRQERAELVAPAAPQTENSARVNTSNVEVPAVSAEAQPTSVQTEA